MYPITQYIEVNSLDEFFKVSNQNEKACIIAGGTDVLVKSRDRDEKFVNATFIGITRIPELNKIYLDKDESICIGAGNSFTAIEKNELTKKCVPVLAYAVSTVGGPQTRNAGTIGGNICNGATSADSAPTLFAYNAILEIHGPKGQRLVPISEFYLGPGRVALESNEILVQVIIKKEDYQGFVGHYTKFAQRNALDIANLSCVTLIRENAGKIEEVRIAYGVAGPTPIRATDAESFAKGKTINDETLKAIGEKCLASTVSRDSWRASKAYRDHLIQLLPGRNILTALEGN